jgi:transcriptional regulator with XRE-family HTH domain
MKDRIRELMEAQHMNQQTFSNYTGINTATLSGILTGRTQATIKVVNLIMRKFPNININWLMFGQGGMLSSSSPTPSAASSETSQEKIFDDTQQPVSPTSQQSTVTSVTMHTDVAPTTQTVQRNTNPTTANMAAMPSFFDTPNAQPSTPVGTANPYTQVQQPRQQQITVHTSSEQKDSPTPQKRRVTEIRVFYDDQTWEAFVPKKN